MSSNDSNLSCFEKYDTNVFAAAAYLIVFIASISCIFCLLMIVLILLLKKYHFFTQRLILYLAIASLANGVVNGVDVFGYKVYRSRELLKLCEAVGCISQVASWWVVLATSCIMLDIFILAAFNRSTERYEWVYVVTTFFSPIVLTSWVPFIDTGYGPAGPVCWIKIRNLDNCQLLVFGELMQLVLYYIPYFLLVVVLTVLLSIALLLIRRKTKRWAGKYDPETQYLKSRMEKEIRPLVAYPIIFLLTNVFSFTYRVYMIVTDKVGTANIILWYLGIGTAYQLQGVLITLAFFLDPETRTRLSWASIRASTLGLFKSNTVSEYPIDFAVTGDSIPAHYGRGVNYQTMTD